jgi:hypothetical protein
MVSAPFPVRFYDKDGRITIAWARWLRDIAPSYAAIPVNTSVVQDGKISPVWARWLGDLPSVGLGLTGYMYAPVQIPIMNENDKIDQVWIPWFSNLN